MEEGHKMAKVRERRSFLLFLHQDSAGVRQARVAMLGPYLGGLPLTASTSPGHRVFLSDASPACPCAPWARGLEN